MSAPAGVVGEAVELDALLDGGPVVVVHGSQPVAVLLQVEAGSRFVLASGGTQVRPVADDDVVVDRREDGGGSIA